MNKLSQQAAGMLLDKLMEYGETRISDTAEGSSIAESIEKVTGYVMDKNDTGIKVMQLVRPILMSKLDEVSASFALKAAQIIEDQDDELTKRSFFSAWDDLARGAKVVVYGLLTLVLLATIAAGYEMFKAEVVDIEMIVFTIGIPAVTLLVLATVPIKAVAYFGLQTATKMVDHKLKKAKETK